MKKTIIFICFFLFGTFLTPKALAESIVDPNSEYVGSCGVVMDINSDSSINVSETIVYNFDDELKPGFSRFLPLKYQDSDGTIYNLRLEDITVTDENGKPYYFRTSRSETEDKSKAYLEIKIGDPKQDALGTKTYVLSYKIRGAIKYFSDHDQLFWNVTGDKWPVYVKYPSLKINLPKQVDRDEISKDCFIGLYSNTTDCIDRIKNKNDPYAYYSYKGVVSGEGMTVIFGFPKGVVYKPTDWQNFKEDRLDDWNNLKKNRPLLISILAALALLFAAIVLAIVFRKKIGGFFAKLKNKMFKKKTEKEEVNSENDSQ